MRLYALLFALAVCRTRAATIPLEAEKPQSNSPVDINEPIEQNAQINLRKVPAAIPVAIVEDPAALKVDENSNDYIPSDDEPTPIIKRLEIDVNDPGEPQRQQHDTQNPEFYERDYFVTDIKQKLLETENVFKKSVSEVNESFENWVPNSQHLTAIQNDIKEMQKKFLAQLSDLNKSLQSYLNPQSTKSVIADPEAVSNLKEVENRLKDLEANFNVGVQTLSEGVKALEASKADGDVTPTEEKPSETGSPNPAPGNPAGAQPTNPFGQVFQFFSDAISNAINQMQNTFNSFNNQNNQQGSTATPPDGVQSDETATTSNPFNIFQFFGNLGNFANFGQPGQTSDQTTQAPANSNPILQALNGNPFIANIVNQFRPQTTTGAPIVDANNDQPIKVAETQGAPAKAENKPQESGPPKDTPAPQTGPIMQIIQNNPIVKGIAQRIQSITNPEKPIKKEPAKVPESVKSVDVVENQVNVEEPISATKGHYGNNNSGNNNDVDGINVKSVLTDEKVVDAPAEEAVLAKEVDEKETALPDKTE